MPSDGWIEASFEHRRERELPEGWEYVALGNLGDWGTGGTPSKSRQEYWTNGTVPWVSPKDMKTSHIGTAQDFISETAAKTAAKLVPSGTVLFVVRGMILAHTFPVALTTREVAFNQDMRSIVPAPGVYGPYLLRVLQHEAMDILHAVKEATHGTLRLESDTLQPWPIPVPPVPEQRRIVDKVEALLAEVNRTKGRLERVRAILKRFRQSVLAVVCAEGDEVNLGDILADIKYGTAAKCHPEARGTPVLRIPNVVGGTIRRDDLKYAELAANEREALRLVPGDLLMVRSNGSPSLVGRAAMATGEEAGDAYAGYLMRLRPKRGMVFPEYLHLALQTYEVRVQIELPLRSTSGVNNINGDEVRALRVRLPSLEAQRAAVKTAQLQLGMGEAIERWVEAAASRVGALPQSILSKAFSGELVPTEAELARAEGREFEPASALLERIGQQGVGPEAPKRGRKAKGGRR